METLNLDGSLDRIEELEEPVLDIKGEQNVCGEAIEYNNWGGDNDHSQCDMTANGPAADPSMKNHGYRINHLDVLSRWFLYQKHFLCRSLRQLSFRAQW